MQQWLLAQKETCWDLLGDDHYDYATGFQEKQFPFGKFCPPQIVICRHLSISILGQENTCTHKRLDLRGHIDPPTDRQLSVDRLFRNPTDYIRQ